MLSKFEQSRRGEESMSITISRSYIDGATGLGGGNHPHNHPKQTPQGLAQMQSEHTKKNKNRPGLLIDPVTSGGTNNAPHHIAS